MNKSKKKNNTHKKIFNKIESSTRWRLKKCLWNECNDNVVLCHSSTRKNLKYISYSSTVYCPQENYFKVNKNPIDKMGIKKASVFEGFCKAHDNNLFRLIEDSDIESIDDEKAYLIFMRTIFYEYTRKYQAYVKMRMLANELRKVNFNTDNNLHASDIKGVKRFLKHDFKYYKEQIISIRSNNNFQKIHHRYKIINKNIKIANSSCINPELESYELSCTPQKTFTLNIIPYQGYTLIIICWIDEHDGAMKDILNKWEEGFDELLNNLIFNESEDYYLSPKLWKSLKKETKDRLRKSLFNRFDNQNSTFTIINTEQN